MFRFTIRDLLWLTVVVACSAIPSFFLGAFWGAFRSVVIRGDYDVITAKEIISAHPGRFSSLTIDRGPLDKFLIEGAVRSQDDIDFLRSELIQAFGQERIRHRVAVTVEPTDSR
jgi:hypothetical protein